MSWATDGNDGRTDAEFLARLVELARDWRYSDEFLGLVVRARYPRDYDFRAAPAVSGAREQA